MKICVLLTVWCCAWFTASAADFYRFEENGKVGLKSENGSIVIPASFEALGWSDGSFSVVGEVTGYQLSGHWGLINLKKELLTTADYNGLVYGSGNFAIARKAAATGKEYFGVINLRGQVVIPFSYEGIWLSGLRAVVTRIVNGRWMYGLVSVNHEVLLPVEYKSIQPIGTLRYAVQNFDQRTALFTDTGKPVTDFNIDSIGSFNHGFALVYATALKGLMNRDGEMQVPIMYRDIRYDESGSTWWLREPDEWSLVDLQNRQLRTVTGDVMKTMSADFIKITNNGLSGLLDKDMKPVWPVRYQDILTIDDAVVLIRQQKFGLNRLDQSVIMSADYDSLSLEGGRVRARRTEYGLSLWSLFDRAGNALTAKKYEIILPLKGTHFPARSRGHWGMLDQNGEETVHCVYDEFIQQRHNLIVTRFHGETGVIDLQENWKVPPQRWPLELINDDVYLRREDSTTYLMDFKGNIIYFSNQQIVVGDSCLHETMPDQRLRKISFAGVDLTPLPVVVKPVSKSVRRATTVKPRPEPQPEIKIMGEVEGLRRIIKDSKSGFLDRNGRLRIANRYDDAMDFHEGRAAVKVMGKWGYITADDEFAIQPTFDTVGQFTHGLAHVRRGTRHGLVNRSGELALPLRYDSIQLLPSGRYRVFQDKLTGLADATGKLFIDPRFEQIADLNNDYLVVQQDGKRGVLNREGMSIIPMHYDQLEFDVHNQRFLALRRSPWKRWIR